MLAAVSGFIGASAATLLSVASVVFMLFLHVCHNFLLLTAVSSVSNLTLAALATSMISVLTLASSTDNRAKLSTVRMLFLIEESFEVGRDGVLGKQVFECCIDHGHADGVGRRVFQISHEYQDPAVVLRQARAAGYLSQNGYGSYI